MTRPALRSACVMISTPTAMRSFSRCTAASILRSSFSMTSTISAGSSLSMARVPGLICSVGSDCHLDRDGISFRTSDASREYYHSRPGGSVTSVGEHAHEPLVDAYLDHLRVERRLAPLTVESYARDLAALAGYAAGTAQRIDALDRAQLEAFVREQRAGGLSPRSVARRVAAVRGFYRFLTVDRRITANPSEDLRPPRAWPSLPKFLSLDEVDRLVAAPDVSTTLGL